MANSETKAKNKSFFSDWLRYQFKEMRKNGSLYLFMLPYLLIFATFTILLMSCGMLALASSAFSFQKQLLLSKRPVQLYS